MDKHGGNQKSTYERYGINPERLIDFSINLNPIRMNRLHQKIMRNSSLLFTSYPDPDYRDLTTALSSFYGLDQAYLLPGNGSAELIHLLPSVLDLRKALIFQPNFSEYEASLQPHSCRIDYLHGQETTEFKTDFALLLEAVKDCQILYLSNPNNPSGHLYTREELSGLLAICEQSRCYLFVDEVFLDFYPEAAQVTLAGMIPDHPYLILLKSLTKFYSMPGIRLGVLLADKKLIRRLKSRQAPWSINNIAQAIGQQAVKQTRLISKTHCYLDKEKMYLYQAIQKLPGLKIFPSAANYFLIKIENKLTINELEKKLAGHHIVIRNCANYPGLNERFFRIAVKRHHENRLLVRCLQKIFSPNR